MEIYKNCYILARVIEEEGTLKFDIPFRTYHQAIVKDNELKYCYFDPSMKDKEVMVYISYHPDDEEKVFKYKGFLGVEWKDVEKSERIKPHWNVTKADYLAETNEFGATIKYAGKDKDKLAKPYETKENK